MNRSQWYFRQRVTNQEMSEFEDFIENADRKITSELLGSGLISGGEVTENSPQDNTFVQVSSTLARDSLGRRIFANDFFADTVSVIVLGLTLQIDGVAVPSTVGSYILFNSAPAAVPFDLVGQSININRSIHSTNNGDYVIQQVVVTDWGGLIPNQIMVRIDEELEEDGYEAGLSPRGTTSLSQIVSSQLSKANVTLNELNQDTKPINPGNERWVSLYARFDRFEFDQRLDGNAEVVSYLAFESFIYVVDDTEAEATAGNAVKPAIRTNGDVLLADVLLKESQVITDADIDITRQSFMSTLPSAVQKGFEYANMKFFGTKITWTGTNLSVAADMFVTLPNRTFKFTVTAFNEVLADGEVLYIILDRTATTAQTVSVVKTTRGTVPQGDDNKLTIELAQRDGTKIQGGYGGELEPGETRDIGDSIGDAYKAYTGMTSEVDSDPDYAGTNYLTGAINLTAADIVLDATVKINEDDITDIENDYAAANGLATLDANAKLIESQMPLVHYFGIPVVGVYPDGSWRTRVSGNFLFFERKVSGVWTKLGEWG